jgi:hypothetical protein
MTQVCLIQITMDGIKMPDTSKAKLWDMRSMTNRWDGYVSSYDKTNLAENILVRGSQNVYKKLSGTIAVRQGQKRQGVANPIQSPISSEFVWNTSWGATYTLVISNSNLYVVIDEVWYSLLSGLTATRYVFDKWWDNTEKKDRVLFVHGNSDIQHWSGGFATILSSTVNTITKTGTTSWQQAGFSTTSGQKTIVIGGTTFTYTGGENTTTLTGVTPDASAIVVGATALQAVQTATDKPSAGFMNDFIKVINNQLYVGSYTSRLIYISKNTDFTDFTVPTPRSAGDPELLTLDGTGKGIGVRQGNPHIGFGSSSWAVVTFNDITVGTDLTQQTKVDVKPVALLQAPLAHEFIDSVGDNLIYLAQDQQVRSFGDFNNLFTSGYPSLSQEVATELMQENFTGGGLRCIGEFIYVTAPISGKTYLKQERTRVDEGGNIVAERLWHSPFIWNATRIDQINGVVVAFSNANPQIYEVWGTNQWFDDSPSDEPLPYRCVMACSYRGGQRRQGLWSFDKQYTEGYISGGTPLNLQMNYNYQGSTATIDAIVNSIEQPAYTFSDPLASLGDSSLGDEPLGDATSDSGEDTLPKFRVINSLGQQNVFEWQPIYFSDEANAQWEILATADNAEVEDQQVPTFIINKRRV